MEENLGGNPFFFLVSLTQISSEYYTYMANGNFLHENDSFNEHLKEN